MDPDGFDAWVRNRLHPESADIPEITSHIDPNLFEADFPVPQSADDLLWWLNTNTDVSMDPENYFDPQIAAPAAAAAAAPPAAQQAAGQGPLQHPAGPQQQFSSWQLAYLQQAVQQQPSSVQLGMSAQKQQVQQPSMYSAGSGYPMLAQLPAASAAAPDSLAFLEQLDPSTALYSWQPTLDPPLAAGAAGAAGVAAPGAALQHAGSSGSLGRRTSPSSSSDKAQHSRRAPISKAPAGAPPAAAAAKGRKPRKVTDAQRAAHKRFRLRRKEKVSSLVAEVAAKQAQLQALEAEREALTAKARALDQLVASAGDNVVLMQHMEALSLGDTDQQQQQLKHSSSGTAATSSSGNSGSVLSLLPSASLDTNAGSAQGDSAGQTVKREGSGATPSADAITTTGGTGAAAESVAVLPTAGSTADAAAVAAAALAGSHSPPGSPSPAATASLERLEAAVRAALGRPLPRFEPHQQQLRLQQFEQSQLQRRLPGPGVAVQVLQLQGTLPSLQQLMKSLIAEITQLVLQVNKGPELLDLGGFSTGASAAAAAAGAAASGLVSQQKSAAAQRLEHIRAQVYGEFRAFAYTNRMSMCLLYTLNLETGQLARPAAGHWKSGAQLLMQRMHQQVLQDMIMAYKLYESARKRVTQQRHALLLQLQGALNESTGGGGARYNRDTLYPDTHSAQCLFTHVSTLTLLNAIDSNLRKEYVMTGVIHWSLNKLLPLMLSAELTVTSYPYLTDLHAIVEELVQLMPPQPDPAAATLAVQQQQQLMLEGTDSGQHEQQQQQQLDTASAGYMQQYNQLQQQPGSDLQYNQYSQQYGQQNGQLQHQGSGPQQQQQQHGYAASRQVSTGLQPSRGSYPVGALFLSMPCS